MEIVVRVIIWSLCLLVYSKAVINRRSGKEFFLKQEIGFSIITSYAFLIVLRSGVFRLSQRMEWNQLIQEVIVGIGMLILYTVIRMLGQILFADSLIKWMYYFTSFCLTIIICVYIIAGAMTREWYLALYVISYVLSVIIVKLKNDNIEISANRVWKTRLKFSLPISLFVGITFFLYMPTELYMGNPQAFMVEYVTFIWPLVVGFLLFIGAYLIITLCFVSTAHYYFCNIFMFCFALLANIQNMLLNGKMQSMDGTKQQWSNGVILSNILIWLIVYVGMYVFAHFAKKKVRNICKVAAYCGVGIQTVSLVVLLLVMLPTIMIDNYVLSTEKTFEISEKENVFVFVLDWFDNQIIEQIVAEDETFLAPLDGFTHYTNATSKYAFTDMSVPYLLTGVEWRYDQLEAEYAKKAQEESQVLELIEDSGYAIGIYTEASYIGEKERSLIENGRYTKRTLDIAQQMDVMAQTARYKTYPFALKNFFFYTDDDMYAMQRTDVQVHNIYNDIPYAQLLVEEGLSVNKEKEGAFKFYHLHGPHTSYLMNENFEWEDTDMLTQAKGSLNIVYEFIHQLKEKGLYEDSTIIITADHGQNYFDRPSAAEELGLEMVSCPIMFVKNKGDYKDVLTESSAPVSHEEVIPTILEAITGDTYGYGRTISEIAENESRERTFVYGRHNDIPFVKYVISGDAMNMENWSEAKKIVEK